MYKNIKQCGAQNKHTKKSLLPFCSKPFASINIVGTQDYFIRNIFCLSSLGFTP